MFRTLVLAVAVAALAAGGAAAAPKKVHHAEVHHYFWIAPPPAPVGSVCYPSALDDRSVGPQPLFGRHADRRTEPASARAVTGPVPARDRPS